MDTLLDLGLGRNTNLAKTIDTEKSNQTDLFESESRERERDFQNKNHKFKIEEERRLQEEAAKKRKKSQKKAMIKGVLITAAMAAATAGAGAALGGAGGLASAGAGAGGLASAGAGAAGAAQTAATAGSTLSSLAGYAKQAKDMADKIPGMSVMKEYLGGKENPEDDWLKAATKGALGSALDYGKGILKDKVQIIKDRGKYAALGMDIPDDETIGSSILQSRASEAKEERELQKEENKEQRKNAHEMEKLAAQEEIRARLEDSRREHEEKLLERKFQHADLIEGKRAALKMRSGAMKAKAKSLGGDEKRSAFLVEKELMEMTENMKSADTVASTAESLKEDLNHPKAKDWLNRWSLEFSATGGGAPGTIGSGVKTLSKMVLGSKDDSEYLRFAEKMNKMASDGINSYMVVNPTIQHTDTGAADAKRAVLPVPGASPAAYARTLSAFSKTLKTNSKNMNHIISKVYKRDHFIENADSED